MRAGHGGIMAFSLFSMVEPPPWTSSFQSVLCEVFCVLCAGLSLCYVQILVCVMCSLQSVLCAVFGLSYVPSLFCVMCSL